MKQSDKLYKELNEINIRLHDEYVNIREYIDTIKEYLIQLPEYPLLKSASLEYHDALQLSSSSDMGIYISSTGSKISWLSKNTHDEILKSTKENMEYPDSLFIYIKEIDTIVHLISEDDIIDSSVPRDKYHQEVINRLTKE